MLSLAVNFHFATGFIGLSIPIQFRRNKKKENVRFLHVFPSKTWFFFQKKTISLEFSRSNNNKKQGNFLRR